MPATIGLTTSTADRRRRAGQRLIIGLSGPSLTSEERALIREIQPGGFVLFARNVEEPAQVRELNRELRALVDKAFPALRCVDQEGGRVQRVRAPATVWPPMGWLGNVGDLRLTSAVAVAMGQELRAMDFDLNFAPVADVNSNPKNPVIGDRAFGAQAQAVSRHVVTFLQAMQQTGVIACVKHFPGHGDTSVDSHVDLPVVEREPPQIEATELVPFGQAVVAGVGTVMTAHVVYPAYDETYPATMSPPIIRGLLREKLGFAGVVFSDDLEMKAVRDRWPLRMQLERASMASVDLFLACKEVSLQHAAFEELIRLQEEDKAQDDAAIDAVKRLNALRLRFLKSPPDAPDLNVLGCTAYKELALRVEAEGRC